MNQEMDHRNKHTSSEPMPGTSRSLLDTVGMHDNDGFGDDFGRKFTFLNFWFEIFSH